jgi:acetyl-CoA synthetase
VLETVEHDTERARFRRRDTAGAALDGLPGGRGLNIAHEAVDRHASGPLASKVAFRFLRKWDEVQDYTFGELGTRSSQFANVLAGLGVRPGERVFALLGRVPELYVTALGALKHRAVFCPVFSAYGPEPVERRLRLGDARVLVTSATLYRRRVARCRDRLPLLREVLLVGDGRERRDPVEGPGILDFDAALEAAGTSYRIGPTDPEDMALLHFTSGTTCPPKGAVHVHAAAMAHHATARDALDLRPDDVFWCTADPGWVTGTSYGIVAPLTHGVTSIVDEAEFDAARWYRILQDHGVTVWYTAPTALRRLMRMGAEAAAEHDLSALRFVASAGEPLNAEAVVWGRSTLGLPIHDTWWQTETGAIMIANLAGSEVRPGSMGRPLPGIVASVLEGDDTGELVLDRSGQPIEVTDPGRMGELALRPGWPSMFRTYLHDEERYRRCFVGGWYRTGDVVRRDTDGYFWFVARGDDLIKTSGHLVGPFEVESALMEHPAVADAGVIGIPDPVAGQRVKAIVLPALGHEPSDELALEVIAFGRSRLGPVIAPKEIGFATTLPRTRSGKIMRRLLRARELGLDEGDTSALESS